MIARVIRFRLRYALESCSATSRNEISTPVESVSLRPTIPSIIRAPPIRQRQRLLLNSSRILPLSFLTPSSPPPASSVASPVPLSIPITPTTTYVLNRRHSRNSLGFSSSQSSTKERNSSEDLHMSTPEEVHSSDKRNSASRSTYHAYEHSRPKSEDRTHRHSFSSLSGIPSSSSKKQSTIEYWALLIADRLAISSIIPLIRSTNWIN